MKLLFACVQVSKKVVRESGRDNGVAPVGIAPGGIAQSTML